LADLLARYGLVRRFLPALLTTLHLKAAPGRRCVPWRAAGRPAEEVPLGLATGAWAMRVLGPDGGLYRPAYTFLVLERLREALRRRDVYARTAGAGAILVPGCWTGRHGRTPGTASRSASERDLDPYRELAVLGADLDAAYRAVAGRLEHNDACPAALTARARPHQLPRPLPGQQHRPRRWATQTAARPHRIRDLTGPATSLVSARSCSVATQSPVRGGLARGRHTARPAVGRHRPAHE